MTHQNDTPGPAAHTRWNSRIRGLRIAGPVPDPDPLADQLTIDISLLFFEAMGITVAAMDMAAEAVLASDAFTETEEEITHGTTRFQ